MRNISVFGCCSLDPVGRCQIAGVGASQGAGSFVEFALQCAVWQHRACCISSACMERRRARPHHHHHHHHPLPPFSPPSRSHTHTLQPRTHQPHTLTNHTHTNHTHQPHQPHTWRNTPLSHLALLPPSPLPSHTHNHQHHHQVRTGFCFLVVVSKWSSLVVDMMLHGDHAAPALMVAT